MYSKLPFSMENIPRQRNFACLSLKFGSILSGIITCLYSILFLAQCMYALSIMLGHIDSVDFSQLVNFSLLLVVSLSYILTLIISAFMMVGTICEKLHFIKPWVVWISIKLIASAFLFVFLSTMNAIGHSEFTFLEYIVGFLFLLIQFYMLMLVASYYKDLEERGHEMKQLRQIDSETWYT